MFRKSTVFVVGFFCLLLAIFASGVERWFPSLAPPIDENVCNSAGARSPVLLGSLVFVCAGLAVALAFVFAKRMRPYRFGENDLASDKDDLWRHFTPMLWMWNAFAVAVSFWRLIEFSGCKATSMPDFARWMMFNNMPGTILLLPLLLGGFAIYAVYWILGLLGRGISSIGEEK
ncbi:MAG: hypothetical protein IT350_07970 [Deltaproteobacteria bacterium]|nr:hypothetical protein [Deltaproteobacteria bacterium]